MGERRSTPQRKTNKTPSETNIVNDQPGAVEAESTENHLNNQLTTSIFVEEPIDTPSPKRCGRPQIIRSNSTRAWRSVEVALVTEGVSEAKENNIEGMARYSMIQQLLVDNGFSRSISQIKNKINNMAKKATGSSTSNSTQDTQDNTQSSQTTSLNNSSTQPTTSNLQIIHNSAKRKSKQTLGSKRKKRMIDKNGVGFSRYIDIILHWLVDPTIKYPSGSIKITEARYQQLEENEQFVEIFSSGHKITYDALKKEYTIEGPRVLVSEFLLGGDSTSLFKNPNNPVKGHITHFSIKNIRVKAHKIHKDLNHQLIGLYEGKDRLLYLLGMLQKLTPVMAQHENQGIFVNGNLVAVKYHFIGDMVFLLQILGLKGTGSTWWCPRCTVTSKCQWWNSGEERNLEQEKRI